MITPERIPNDDLRRVSGALSDLRDRLAPGAHGGRFLTAEEIVALMEELGLLTALAKRIENEISAHRWNEAGRQDREDDLTETVLRASEHPDGRVVLFPAFPRTFGDGA